MGRGGSECECPPDEISAHFCVVGSPPADPAFCKDCLTEAVHWIESNIRCYNNRLGPLNLLWPESKFSTTEVTTGFKELKNSALGLEGLSKNIIFRFVR